MEDICLGDNQISETNPRRAIEERERERERKWKKRELRKVKTTVGKARSSFPREPSHSLVVFWHGDE